MAWYSAIGGFFKKIGSFLTGLGVSDELVKLAYGAVKIAEERFIDNAAKREFAVAFLVGKGIPESLARLAVELAVRLLKKEIAAHA